MMLSMGKHSKQPGFRCQVRVSRSCSYLGANASHMHIVEDCLPSVQASSPWPMATRKVKGRLSRNPNNERS